MGVEGVLVTVHMAVVDDGHVGSHTEGDSLVLGGSGTVLESYVLRHETNPNGS